MDIEMAVDMMEMAEHLDHVVLFSGDGDFRRWWRRCSARACASRWSRTIKSQPPMVADELRRQADNFIELAELAPTDRAQPVASAPQRPAVADGDLGEDHEPERPDAVGLSAYVAASPLEEPPRDCPLCPRLVAFRHELQGHVSRLDNAPVPLIRRLDARLLIVGLAPGHAAAPTAPGGRSPATMPATALRDAAEVRLRRRAPTAPIRTTACGWSTAASPTRCAACRRRTSRCPTRSRVPAVPAGRARGDAEAEGRSWRWARARMTRCCARLTGGRRAPIRSCTAGCTRCDGPHARRQLPLLALQHEHRQADDRDVPRRVRECAEDAEVKN